MSPELELPDFLTAVRSTTDRAQEDRWVLALVALGIPHQVLPHPEGEGRILVVRKEDQAATVRTITEVDEEQVQRLEEARQPPPQKVPGWAYWFSELMVLALTVMAFLSGPRSEHGPLINAGNMDATRVLTEGELHRLITAVTLHADGAHLLSNLLFLMVVAPIVVHRMGPGAAAFTLVTTGAVGNIISTAIHGLNFSNVGASGGLFGLLCVLGLLTARTRQSRLGRNRWILGAGAALALLSMLGFGENSDIAAHLGGFAAGAPLGLLLPIRKEQTPRAWWWSWQLLLLGISAAAVGWAWWQALAG